MSDSERDEFENDQLESTEESNESESESNLEESEENAGSEEEQENDDNNVFDDGSDEDEFEEEEVTVQSLYTRRQAYENGIDYIKRMSYSNAVFAAYPDDGDLSKDQIYELCLKRYHHAKFGQTYTQQDQEAFDYFDSLAKFPKK